MSFPRYPAYKDCGVEWLGEVPAHWGVMPLKHLADFINGDAFKPSEWADAGTPIIRIQNLNGGEEFNYFAGEVEERYLVRESDLLFGWSGNRGTSFGPFIWRHDGIYALNQHIFRVIPRAMDPKGLYWILKAVTAHVEDQAHGIIGMVHITKGDLGAVNVPIPNSDEQTAIAAFLDRETAKIDALVAEQEKLIELLKEKRQAVISHAVTKGLDPNVPMKDSGVEWLGEVPAHWVVESIKWLSPVLRGASPRPIDDQKYFDDDGEYAWVRIADASASDGVLLETTQRLSDLGSSLSVKLEPGSLFVSIAGTVGKPCVAGIKCCIHDGFVYFPRLRIDPQFLFRLFEHGACYAGLGKMGTQLNLNTDTIGSIRIGLPPPDELNDILRFIDSQAGQFGELMSAAEVAVALLQERRAALISAAVTGQIDVRSLHAEQATATD